VFLIVLLGEVSLDLIFYYLIEVWADFYSISLFSGVVFSSVGLNVSMNNSSCFIPYLWTSTKWNLGKFVYVVFIDEFYEY